MNVRDAAIEMLSAEARRTARAAAIRLRHLSRDWSIIGQAGVRVESAFIAFIVTGVNGTPTAVHAGATALGSDANDEARAMEALAALAARHAAARLTGMDSEAGS